MVRAVLCGFSVVADLSETPCFAVFPWFRGLTTPLDAPAVANEFPRLLSVLSPPQLSDVRLAIRLPFGIWALLVLSRRDVRTAFADWATEAEREQIEE